MRLALVLLLTVSISSLAYADEYVCAQVVPVCDAEGNLAKDFTPEEDPCFYYYTSICLAQKLEDVAKENRTFKKKVKKLKKKLKRKS